MISREIAPVPASFRSNSIRLLSREISVSAWTSRKSPPIRDLTIWKISLSGTSQTLLLCRSSVTPLLTKNVRLLTGSRSWSTTSRLLSTSSKGRLKCHNYLLLLIIKTRFSFSSQRLTAGTGKLLTVVT
jgi:hypothetical protein